MCFLVVEKVKTEEIFCDNLAIEVHNSEIENTPLDPSF